MGTQFFMTSDPMDYFQDLVTYLQSKNIDYRISGSNLRLKFNTTIAVDAEEEEGEEEVKQAEQSVKVNDHKSAVKFSYRDTETKRDVHSNSSMNHYIEMRDAEPLKIFNDTTFDE